MGLAQRGTREGMEAGRVKRVIKTVDLYCGAGGSSSGLFRAAERIGFTVDLVAINHWKLAVATHAANHPTARHMETSINQVDPREVVPGGKLDLLWASPECIHFSVARGGKPVNPQSRASAWHVLHWAETLTIDNIIIENVREFQTWGPLKRVLRKGKRAWIPDPKRKGETYRAFLAALRSMNYNVETRILNAADYGDPTTRERLFIIARRGRRKISWPGKSIFGRKKPLAPATIARILAGLEKYNGKQLEPFLVVLRNHADAQSVDSPIPALTAGGNHMGIARPEVATEPFQVIMRGKSKTRDIDQPTPTGSTKGAHLGVAQPFILPHRMFDGMQVDSIDRPLRTIRAVGNNVTLVEPFIVPQFGERKGQQPRTHSIDAPLPAATGHGAGALVEPFLTRFNGNHSGKTDGANRAHSVEEPIGTLDTSNRFGLAEPVIVPCNHGKNDTRSHSIERPMPGITTVDALGLAEPIIAKYYSTGQCRPVSEPLDTITTKDRFGLVMPVVNGYALDIKFRMLHPKELAAAMGFESDYHFEGSREAIVKQIGNAVAVNTAQALCEAVLS